MVEEASKDMNACEDFFLLVVESHITTATMSVCEMSSVEDKPCFAVFPESASE